MIVTVWLSLPDGWTLTDVQAGVQVIIAILCTLGIFVFARFCWQLSSLDIAKNRAVTLSSLISINTIGEALDALFLLRRKIFRPRYWRILSQSITVILLTIAAIVSGPIAKASTRIGTDIHTLSEPGLLSNRGFNSLGYGYVQWNQTATSLDRAGFPLDQLLDFLPNPDLRWVYKPDEWNSSWSMTCNRTDYTSITLTDTGNCTGLYHEVPGVNTFFPQDDYTAIWSSWYGFYANSTFLNDALLVIGGWNFPGYNSQTGVTLGMTFSVAAVHLQNLAKAKANSVCLFGKGPIQSSVYNMVQCDLRRRETIPNKYNVAFPDHADRDAVVDAYIANYIMRMARESVDGRPVTGITTSELIRFYQAYLAVKDTYHAQPVTRSISMDVSVVQISLTFVIVISLLVLVDLLGIINYIWFLWKHPDIVIETPESKLDWAVQSIIETPENPNTPVPRPHSRWSVVAAVPGSHVHLPRSEKIRTYFEHAKFRGHGQEDTVPLNYAAYTMPHSHISPPEQPLYNMNPYDGQYGAYNANPGLGVQSTGEHIYMPYSGRAGYSRLT